MQRGLNNTGEEKIKAICFTGHRIIGPDLNEDLLDKLLAKLTDKGYKTFICGGALGFDTFAAEKVIELKKKDPEIRLHIYVPCRDQDKKWSFSDKRRYKKILEKADLINIMAETYYDGCMKARNYKMVEDSAVCLCYLNNDLRSGTAQTVRYALKLKRVITNVSTYGATAYDELW